MRPLLATPPTFFVAAFFAAASAVAQAEEAPLPVTVEFNRDIRPILSDNCFKCHGPDKAKRKADLRLDVEESAKGKVEDDIFVIAPGNVAKSDLIRRITTDNADDHMPPLDSAKQLTSRQVALLTRWVEQGAKWQPHWAFLAPVRSTLPAVKDAKWSRNPIDRFILARLEQEGLQPSPEADRSTLIRRVTLDLTGLPPTLVEVDAFLKDSSPQAYERVVDRLLASPRYGEKMASRWLDAARYADTNGYQTDGERTMWRWRDWVIDAYNRNLSFDKFTIEQLAGDLLPGATRDQRIATGFNRNHRGNGEGGIVPAEYAAEYVVDRVDTTSTVWLGLTMGCARCHDHKYDPIAQKEFYQAFAFFNNVPETGQANKYGNSAPMIVAPTPAQERELAQVDRTLAAAEGHLLELEPQVASAQAEWEQALAKAAPVTWTPSRGLAARFELDGNLASALDAKAAATIANGEPAFGPGRRAQAAKLDGRRFVDAGDVGNFGFYDRFTLTAWINPRGTDGLLISRMVTQADDPVFTTDGEGYGVMLAGGKLQVLLTKRWLDDALRVETEVPLATGQWQHIAVVYDGSRLASGVKIYVDGKLQRQKVLLDELNQSFAAKRPLRIGAVAGPELDWSVGDVRVYNRALPAEEIAIVATAENVNELALVSKSRCTPAQAAKLRAAFLTEFAPAPMREAQAKVVEVRQQRARLVDNLPTSMVMEEMAEPRETHILKRGQYDQPAERVMPGTPAFLSAWAAGEPRNRLGFARWLVDPANPLTARVAVNNQWQAIFGVGLVKTTEDFGSQGEPPSHPELLDWLATEFVRTGWDTKAMLKTLVTSATYRQSSRVTPALLARDPENRLLAHASRLRLPAETIRDQALAVSGLLVAEIGGPSVKPYQPKGLWKELGVPDYVPDHGDKLWRRSLYTFWKRTAPPPTMATFDASARESCMVRPARTDTPLQALALMNDVTFVEASRRLAQRVMLEAAGRDERLRLAFRLVLTREPAETEMAVLLRDWDGHRTRFLADAKAAGELVSAGEAPRDEKLDVPELAAYAATCGLILNLDEAITRP